MKAIVAIVLLVALSGCSVISNALDYAAANRPSGWSSGVYGGYVVSSGPGGAIVSGGNRK
jgi:hypothetical protein